MTVCESLQSAFLQGLIVRGRCIIRERSACESVVCVAARMQKGRCVVRKRSVCTSAACMSARVYSEMERYGEGEKCLEFCSLHVCKDVLWDYVE